MNVVEPARQDDSSACPDVEGLFGPACSPRRVAQPGRSRRASSLRPKSRPAFRQGPFLCEGQIPAGWGSGLGASRDDICLLERDD